MEMEWVALRAWRETRECPHCDESGEHHHTEDVHAHTGQREVRAWCPNCDSVHKIEIA